jgi:protease-4
MPVKKRQPLLVRLGALATIISSIISFIFFVFVLLLFVPGLTASWEQRQGNVAVIDINGLIISGKAGPFDAQAASANQIVDLIKQADDDSNIKAIVLRIDSPGGMPVASSQIARAVKEAKKPTIAVIGETGASGAYWVASAANRVFADRLSITGSIGVEGSYLQFSGLLNKYNVTYERLVGGDLKDAGSPYKPLTQEERQALQRIIDQMREEFISAVAINRKLPHDDVARMANGFVYLGSEAKELGLVDQLGGMEDAYNYINSTMGFAPEPIELSAPPTLLEALTGMLSQQSFSLGQGIGAAFTSTKVQSSVPTLVT